MAFGRGHEILLPRRDQHHGHAFELTRVSRPLHKSENCFVRHEEVLALRLGRAELVEVLLERRLLGGPQVRTILRNRRLDLPDDSLPVLRHRIYVQAWCPLRLRGHVEGLHP